MNAFSDAGSVLLRIIVISLIALAIIRAMGNRAVGQFSPLDFVIMVGIGDIVVTVAMTEEGSLINGVAALLALLVLQKVLSYLALKSSFLRKLLEGTPVTFIENGKILRENFKYTNFNYDDLRQELHRKGMDLTNVQDIKIARLESCGEFSVIKTPETETITKRDLENFVEKLLNNPLHPAGSRIAGWEKLIEDVHVLADYVRKQQVSSKQEGKENK